MVLGIRFTAFQQGGVIARAERGNKAYSHLHSRLLFPAYMCGLCLGRYKYHVYSYHCLFRRLSITLKAIHEPFTSFICLHILIAQCLSKLHHEISFWRMATFSSPTSVTEKETGSSPELIWTDSSAMKMAGLCGMASVRIVLPCPLLLLFNYHTTFDIFTMHLISRMLFILIASCLIICCSS